VFDLWLKNSAPTRYTSRPFQSCQRTDGRIGEDELEESLFVVRTHERFDLVGHGFHCSDAAVAMPL